MKYSISLLAFGLLVSVGARGATIVSAQSVTAAAGASGSFDVTLDNTGPSSITVGAFTFGISINNPSISFTDVNKSTPSYIFGSNSLFGPDLTGPISGQSLSASDVFAIPFSGAVIASGATVELGQVLFTVASDSAAGAFTSTLLPDPATSLSDAAGNVIVIDTLNTGTITVTSSTAVPECSSAWLLLAGIPLLWLKRPARSR